MPGTPGKLRLGDDFVARGVRRGGGEGGDQIFHGLGVGGGVGGVGLHAAGCAAPEQEGAGDQVGRVEARCGEGDDVFEDGGGADVD